MKLNEEGHAIMLTISENKVRLAKLRKLCFADLKALEKHTIKQMDYFQRRFPKDKKGNKNIYNEMYSYWVWWHSLNTALELVIIEYIVNLEEK